MHISNVMNKKNYEFIKVFHSQPSTISGAFFSPIFEAFLIPQSTTMHFQTCVQDPDLMLQMLLTCLTELHCKISLGIL